MLSLSLLELLDTLVGCITVIRKYKKKGSQGIHDCPTTLGLRKSN